MKILVVGFARSGTMLLMEFIGLHPQVRQMFDERNIIFGRTKEELFRLRSFRDRKKRINRVRANLKTDIWGEKIIFVGRSNLPSLYIKYETLVVMKYYCKKWNKFFLPDARIIFIVRHPLDVIPSILKRRKKWTEVDRQEQIKQYFEVMPEAIKFVKTLPNCLIVKFEDLTSHPVETLTKVFAFCNLDTSLDLVTSITKTTKLTRPHTSLTPSRAFAYKRKNRRTDYKHLDRLLKILNTIEGVKYERG